MRTRPTLREHPLVFLEVQCQPDVAFHARWFAEIHLYLYRAQVLGTWRAVTIFPSRAAESPAPPAYATLLANPWVHRVYLDEVLPRAGTTAPGLGLIGLMLAKPQAAAQGARDLVHHAEGDRDWIIDWVETILVYKFPKLSREEIRMLLDLKDPDLTKTRFFQEVYAEGREEGREEGRRGEAMGLVLRQLRRRLGPLSADSEGRIAALTLVQIEALGDWLRRQG